MRRRLSVIVLALGLAVTACSGGAPGSAQRPTSTPTGATAVAPSGSAAVTEGPFVRSCDSSVYGELGRGWRTDSVIAGPVAFVGLLGYAEASTRELSIRPGRATPVKVLLVVDRGVEATVSIAPRARDRAGLVYDPRLFNRRNLPIEGFDDRVGFEACPTGPGTQFNGGLAVTGRACVPVVVRSDGAVYRAVLSFAAGDCG